MDGKELDKLFEYAVTVRRRLHEYPEIGFELDKTVEFVSGELEKAGIAYTHRYGKGSVVADLGQGETTLAIRADMDALPVDEKTDVQFKSKIGGAMHACGHDTHTGVLLATARYLKENEKRLKCKVRLIFQPSEEGAVSGAKMMTENGVMEGVDRILCTHCENAMDTGIIGVHSGDYMAACIPLSIRFKGRTAHAAIYEQGIDAVAMAVEAYNEMKATVKEEADGKPYIWNVGRFSGGHVHNVVADSCVLDISFRFYDMSFAKRVERRVEKICKDIAGKYGGSVETDWHISTLSTHNDEEITNRFTEVMSRYGFNFTEMPARMSSEDFAWYLEKAPGMIFRFGTRNESLGCTALAHRNDFKVDENGMREAIRAFITYVLYYYSDIDRGEI